MNAPRALLLAFAASSWLGCAAPDAVDVSSAPGEPLPGLDSAALARFAAGREIFHKEFTPEEGLGPLFNQMRCSSCHDLPSLGGSGVETVTKATHFDPATGCDLLVDEGGDLIQQRATPLLEALGIRREEIPLRANALVEAASPPLYGMGLIEAIPDSEILARADSADESGDGISGRPGRTADGRVGRFGRKAEFATLPEFVAAAFVLEMGLTSSLRPQEQTVNGVPLPAGADPASDPEIDDHTFGLVVDYVRLLAMPARDTSTSARDTLAHGERTFRDLGCDACHTPVMRTGPSPIPALDRKAVPLYSDLLLHDLGSGMATTCGAAAGPSEYRTAPLVGVRLRPTLLNDGRAFTIEQAILEHGGEAEPARRRYERLPEQARSAFIRWLRSL